MNEPSTLRRLFLRRRRYRLLEGLLFALTAGLAAGAVLHLIAPSSWSLPLAGGTVALTGFLAGWYAISEWRRSSPLDLAYYLNRRYPELQDSADLLLREEESLPGLSQRQYRRVGQVLDRLDVNLPHRLPLAASALIVAGAFAGLSIQLAGPWGRHAAGSPAAVEHAGSSRFSRPTPPLPPQVAGASIRIVAPAYAGGGAQVSRSLDVEALAGARLTWELRFSRPVSAAFLVMGDGRRLPLRESDEQRYSAGYTLESSTFYSLLFVAAGSDTIRSDYYQLIALSDSPPQIRVLDLPEYAEYPFSAERQIAFSARIEDDYGLTGARLVATITRGEGESVTFRDDTLAFDTPLRRGATGATLKKSIRLSSLGMEPGDELYLHIEATDNRSPAPQTTKTAKYIVAFEDPEQASADMAGGLAVDRLPEYFRSQRQIIIDTERLLAEAPRLDGERFRERSNNIGIDQKLLRLRYGKFLGEEAVTVIGEGADPRAAAAPEEEEEHEHAPGETHEEEHDHAGQEPGAGEDPLAPYAHFHDLVEEATFFDAVTTAKLRAALADMWKAELHLRLGEPRRALPYEYQALKLIKEVQQASRIYVERVGFDPPLIKEAEKRLTGDLKDVAGAQFRRAVPEEKETADIQAALAVLEQLRNLPRPPNAAEYAVLQAAGNHLAARSLEQPGAYLVHLQQLRQLMDDTAPAGRRERYREQLIRVFWRLLPDRQRQPLPGVQRSNRLHDLYLEEMQKQ